MEGEGEDTGKEETYDSQMPVNGGDALVGTGLQQLGCDDLLDGQDDAVLCADAD